MHWDKSSDLIGYELWQKVRDCKLINHDHILTVDHKVQNAKPSNDSVALQSKEASRDLTMSSRNDLI